MKVLIYSVFIALFAFVSDLSAYELRLINPPEGLRQNLDYMSFVIKSDQVMKVTFFVTDEIIKEKVIEITQEYNPANQSSMEIIIGTFDSCCGAGVKKILFANVSRDGRKNISDRWILDTFPWDYKFVYMIPMNKIYVDNLSEEVVLGTIVKSPYEKFRPTPGKFAVTPQQHWTLRLKTEGRTRAEEKSEHGPEVSIWGFLRKISFSLGTQIQF